MHGHSPFFLRRLVLEDGEGIARFSRKRLPRCGCGLFPECSLSDTRHVRLAARAFLGPDPRMHGRAVSSWRLRICCVVMAPPAFPGLTWLCLAASSSYLCHALISFSWSRLRVRHSTSVRGTIRGPAAQQILAAPGPTFRGAPSTVNRAPIAPHVKPARPLPLVSDDGCHGGLCLVRWLILCFRLRIPIDYGIITR